MKFLGRHCGKIAAMAFLAVAVFCWNAIREIDFSLIENRSSVLYDVNGNVIGYTLSKDSDSYRFYTKIGEVDDLYLKMLIANEDRRFYEHCGVDFAALIRAFVGNVRANAISSGGSTIAMQVAKRLTGHERTYFNKLKEIVQAVYLTERYGREQVLEWYLTLAPFGSNIEGVKAASLRWFGHLPNKMSPSEAALLTALPRAPERIRPDRGGKSAKYYKNEVLRLSFEKGVIGKDVWQLSLDDEMPDSIKPIPQNALTLAGYLLPGNLDVRTRIRSNVQRLLMSVGDAYRLSHSDGSVLSAVVLDASTHEVVGILGSSDLEVSQMCLPMAKRSPGSALKPFGYAMAFEMRLAHPGTLLSDKKKLLGTWSPNNFTGKFSGKIPARDALTRSLNLPALEIMSLVGPKNFYARMNFGRQRLFARGNEPDMSLILGSGAISLFDLAKLYAMLNEDGMMKHYVLRDGEEIVPDLRILEQDAARATYEILKASKRPKDANGMDEVSYKTGTSSKFVDAVAVGSMGNYTVAVAIRVPDNRQTPHKYEGYADASPVLFKIMKGLDPEPFSKPEVDSELLDRNAPVALKEIFSDDAIVDPKELKIIFPTSGSAVMADEEGRVFVKTRGGAGKKYLTAGSVQTTDDYFYPDGEGVYEAVVMDEEGRADSVVFSVLMP